MIGGRLCFFWFGGVSEERGELGAEEVDFVLKMVDVGAGTAEGVARGVPENDESNCKNGDQKEFHKQLLGL